MGALQSHHQRLVLGVGDSETADVEAFGAATAPGIDGVDAPEDQGFPPQLQLLETIEAGADPDIRVR